MNDMSSPRLWARKGEAVTCTCDHVICHIACDIAVGGLRAAEHFCDWEQSQPDAKAEVAKICCQECRGFWIRGVQVPGGLAYQFHFADGWR